jgi:hypothetical protein
VASRRKAPTLAGRPARRECRVINSDYTGTLTRPSAARHPPPLRPDDTDRTAQSTNIRMHPLLHPRHLLLASALLALASPVMAGSLRVTIERAGIQVSQLDPLLLTTETFDAAAAGAGASTHTARSGIDE